MVALGTIILACNTYGCIVGSDARVPISNKRWRSVSDSYEWELQSRSAVPGSPVVLKIFMDNGVELCRNVQYPLFLSNYISVDSPTFGGVDAFARDNTIYSVNDKACVLRNKWWTDELDSETSVIRRTTLVYCVLVTRKIPRRQKLTRSNY